MNSIYNQGYSDALVKLGLDTEKTARLPLGGIKRMMTGAKGLLSGMKTKAQGVISRFGKGRLPSGKTAPSTADMNQSLSQLRGKGAPVGPVTGGAPAPAAPPQASRIQQFEGGLKGSATPPQSPKSWSKQQKLKSPASSAPGEVAGAPGSSVASDVLPTAAAVADTGADAAASTAAESAEVLKKAPGDKKPGLLAKGLRWGLPTAAVGAGIYGMTRGQQPAPAPEQYYGEQYAPQYAGAVPMY